MTPEMYRVLVPATAAGVRPAILVASSNYRRRVSIMYRRRVIHVQGVDTIAELFVYTKDSVSASSCGPGVQIPSGIQFQVELDRMDRLLAIADANAALNPENGIETSVVIETLETLDIPIVPSRRGGV